MKSAPLAEVRKELQLLDAADLAAMCVALARYKKENKEYLDYLLFKAHNKESFVTDVKAEVDEQFAELGRQSNLYYAKKSLRKILRMISRYCRFINTNTASAELYIYFCFKLKNSGIPFRKSQMLVNLYEQQLKKINSLVDALHEDLQQDYARDLEEIAL